CRCAPKGSRDRLAGKRGGRMRITDGMQAVVSGGASGLGRAVAETLAGAGARVTIFDLNEGEGHRVAAAIGGTFARVDVADPASVAAGLALVPDPLRIAVNCAGIGPAARTVSRGAAHD